jgi:HEAT repeat protein
MLESEKSEFAANIVWKKLLDKKTICGEDALSSAYKKIPEFQRPQLLRVLVEISKNPDKNPIVSEAVNTGTLEEKAAVIEALASRKDLGDEILAKFAEDGDIRLRLAAAKSLPRDGRLAFLLKLSEDEDYEVRRLAAISLGAFGKSNKKEAVSGVMKRLGDPELLVRNEAEKILIGNQIGEEYLKEIQGKYLNSDSSMASSIVVLGDLKFTAASQDIHKILIEKNNDEIKRRALMALGRLEYFPSAKDAAKSAGSANPEVRRAAAFALGNLKDKETFEAIAKLANDSEDEVSAEALSGIAKIADPFFLDTVAGCIKKVKARDIVRSSAARAAGKIKESSAEIKKSLKRICVDKTIPVMGMGDEFDSDYARASAAWALVDIALMEPAFAKEAKDILTVLQMPLEKQNEKLQSSEALIEYSRQAEKYLNGEECSTASKVTPVKAEMIINPFESK